MEQYGKSREQDKNKHFPVITTIYKKFSQKINMVKKDDNIIEYDIVVIGAGGGANIVKQARLKGLRVAVIEKDRIGGTCLNRGCIPSKMMIHPADLIVELKDLKKFSIKADTKFKVNFNKLTSRISNTVFGQSDSLAKVYKNKYDNLDFYHKEAKFISNKVLQIGRKKITGKKIVIAVGARPGVPPIPGLIDTPYWTSTEALRAETQPKKLIVIGGGYIAVELGHAYSALGTDTHFLVRGDFIAREDKDIIKEFTKVFREKQKIHDISNILNVEYINKTFTVTYTDQNNRKRKISGDKLLLATGIKPNNDLLGLENTKIETNKFGYINVDKYLETKVKGVYAIGDCIGHYLFRHGVNFETEYLTPILINKAKKVAIKYPPVPHAIFSSPQVAGVGLTEQECEEQKIPYIIGMNKYIDSAMGMARLSETGFVKLIFHKKTQKLIGAHIIGQEASNMIHMLIYAITFNAKLDDLLKMIYIHPALPEIVRNACRKAKINFK